MGEHVCGGIMSISSSSHVHGYETPTEHQVILEQRRFIFSLPNYFKHHDLQPLHGIEEMSSYY
jgi:hypothetical protein